MEYAAGTVGRVFLIRIDHGEDLLTAVTAVAEREAVEVGLVLLLGALERGRLVEGPETLELPPIPIATAFFDGREVLGIGTVVCEGGRPVLHLHAATGRSGRSAVGCLRSEAQVFAVAEAVLLELAIEAVRCSDAATGLSPLVFRP
jgi:predicted DNA-binding protein with PD1-like motif